MFSQDQNQNIRRFFLKPCNNGKGSTKVLPKTCMLLIALVIMLTSFQIPAFSEMNLEHKVKAAYIFKMLKFIEWKNITHSPQHNSSLNICIVGSDPVVEAVHLLDSKKSNGHTISVTHKNRSDNLIGCQIVFVARSEQSNLDEILAATSPETNLTISDIQGFAKSGGMVELALIESKVKLVINLKEVSNSLVSFSSKLLNIAILINKHDG